MGSCITPFMVRDKMTNQTIPVPCGKCPQCAARRASGWSFRLMEEEKVSDSANFITLTYDTKFIPITDNGFMGLRKRDLQLFFKRLRKAQELHTRALELNNGNYGIAGKSPVSGEGTGSQGVQKPVKYYAVGEYGGKSRRPHYHIILFNAKLELIQPAWELGQVHYGTVTGASIGYCLKYISKPSQVPLHQRDDRQKEFALMSKGLGKAYLTDQKKNIIWQTLKKGFILPMRKVKKWLCLVTTRRKSIMKTRERL